MGHVVDDVCEAATGRPVISIEKVFVVGGGARTRRWWRRDDEDPTGQRQRWSARAGAGARGKHVVCTIIVVSGTARRKRWLQLLLLLQLQQLLLLLQLLLSLCDYFGSHLLCTLRNQQ